MSDIDPNTAARQGHRDLGKMSSPSSTYPSHKQRGPPPSRDDAMGRDQGKDDRDDFRGGRQALRENQGFQTNNNARQPSSPPFGSRSSHPYRDRGRDRKPYEGKHHGDDRDFHPDRRHRGPPPPSRDQYFDGKTRTAAPGADSRTDSSKRHERSSSPRPRVEPKDHSERHHRDRSFSPSSRKRPRSRSPLPFPPSRSKRSKRDRERDRRRRAERDERFDRERHKGPLPFRSDRPHSPPRHRSISPRYDDPRNRFADRGDDFQRRRSRSPQDSTLDERPRKPPGHIRGDLKPQERSRSPRVESRRSSFSRTHSPPRPSTRPPPRGPSDMVAHSRRSPPFEPSRPNYPPRSPRGSRRSRKKAKQREEARFAPQASGANSIEVNTFRRDRRSSFELSEPFTNRPHKHPDDAYPNDLSPRHHSVSPRPGSRSVSPYPRGITSHSNHNDTISIGSARHRDTSGSPPHSLSGNPPPHPRGRGFSRGSFRGGFHSARPNLGDNDLSRHDHFAEQRDLTGRPSTSSDHGAASLSDHTSFKEDDKAPDNLSRHPLEDEQDEDPSDGRVISEQDLSGPPSTAPTGPASSKFSFAFNKTTKNPVAAPKPEISQKFSAAPKKDVPPTEDTRERDLPKDTPRGPASGRNRAEYRDNRPPPEKQPRTRIVKKIRRKLKPKPALDPELAKSVSVYFRKPGNESVIGSGTYGKVFKGKHVYNQKLVALKRIRMEGERDGFPVTAMREVKLLQSLRHPNVVQLHEMMIEKNECYMVFEYLSHDLTGLLNHPSYKLDAAQKKHLALQLFQGLEYLHKRGVLHRDIKAANILVSNEGILKFADFGLARFYAKRHQIDYTNRVITIWYRSPELLLGETRYDGAVDIWSAACVMIEIFTRHAIFPGDGGEISQLEKIYDILGTPNRKDWPGLVEMPWFELLRPGHRRPNVFAEKYKERLPAAAFDLLAEMFQYDPLKRPTASDILEHPYFTVEQPRPRQAIELKDIEGDWHEFESKQLRREKEKQEKQQREARRAAAAAAAAQESKESKESNADKDKKRPLSTHESQPDSKRQHLEEQTSDASHKPDTATVPPPAEKAEIYTVEDNVVDYS